jgi:hypothetical protein
MIDDDRASGECDVNAFPTWQNETVPISVTYANVGIGARASAPSWLENTVRTSPKRYDRRRQRWREEPHWGVHEEVPTLRKAACYYSFAIQSARRSN